MTKCPECDAEIDLDEDEVEEGEILSCPECDAELEVTTWMRKTKKKKERKTRKSPTKIPTWMRKTRKERRRSKSLRVFSEHLLTACVPSYQ